MMVTSPSTVDTTEVSTREAASMRTSPAPSLIMLESTTLEVVIPILPAPVVTSLLSTRVLEIAMSPAPVVMVESATVLEGVQPSAVASVEGAR